MAASSVSSNVVPGSGVNSPESSAAESPAARLLAPWFCPAASVVASAFCAAIFCFSASARRACCQFHVLIAPSKIAAPAKAHAATTAPCRTAIERCRARNSCRSRISTRAGVRASKVSSPSARNSSLAASQDSCSAAQRGQWLRCASAAALSSESPPASRPRSSTIASTCSQFIAFFPNDSKISLPRRFHAPGHVPQHLQFRQEQGASAMQPRTDRSNRAARRLCCFLVTHLFQLAHHHSLAKLCRQIQHRSSNLVHALSLFHPHHRRKVVLQNDSRSGAVLVFFFERYFSRSSLQMLHYPIAGDSE